MMRPFFSYFGSKYTGAKYYGAPRRSLVIEPFAGSAAYSVRWEPGNVRLYDLSPDVCDLWDWLIKASERDVASIPDYFERYEEIESLPRGASLLVRFWVSKGRAEPSKTLSPWYFQYRGAHDCRVWGPAVKARIIAQKPRLSRWSIDCLSYDQIPVVEAHWHVDPPYAKTGVRYPFSSRDIDFGHLAEWCSALPGTVDVCEANGANWLPFEPLYNVVSTRGRRGGFYAQEALARR